MAPERMFKRVEFHAPAQVTCEGDLVLDAEVMDISLKGVLLQAISPAQAPQVGQTCMIRLHLAEDADDASTRIDMISVVRNSHDDLFGAQWKDIELDDLTRLRRLLELNLGDDGEAIERELGQLRLD
ncbi:MAG: PilZ domain-containing protein [Halothiobacillaceae bacterium]